MPENSLGRRSAQTVLYYTLELLVRTMAPIMSFTGEEIWQEMRNMWPNVTRHESVFLADLSEIEVKMANYDNNNSLLIKDNWLKIQNYRTLINKEIENLRINGKLGSSLEAKVFIYCAQEIYDIFALLQDELKFIFITSDVKIKSLTEISDEKIVLIPAKLAIEVIVANTPKCPRCWHYSETLGTHIEHKDLCTRCISNLYQDGEKRSHA